MSNPGSSARRIRIGLTGLAFAFLFILLGSVISNSSREEETTNAIENAVAAEPNEALAELGVAPGAGEAREAEATAEAKAEAERNAAQDATAPPALGTNTQ